MASSDITGDPKFQEFAERAITKLVPMVDESAYCVALVPRKPEDFNDIKFCIELGMMIMMDKPIVFVIAPGTKVPEKLIKVADRIIELDTNDAKFMATLEETLQELTVELGL